MGQLTLGVDIGGTKVQAGLVGKSNTLMQSEQFLIKKKTKAGVLSDILRGVDRFFSSRVCAVGIGITGLVDADRGIVVQSPNLPKDWKNVPLKRIIERKFKVPVSVDNDVNASALAEATVGNGRGYPVVATLALGTGVGFGLVIDGQNFSLFRHNFRPSAVTFILIIYQTLITLNLSGIYGSPNFMSSE